MQQQSLFSNYKYCEYCGNPLPLDYEGNICIYCQEHMLFRKVKDYIRANDVTEFDVAEHFQIPLQKVKQWIREGRIEYKDIAEHPKALTAHCRKCGAPIAFGSLCAKCQKKQNMTGVSKADSEEAGRMRYLEEK